MLGLIVCKQRAQVDQSCFPRLFKCYRSTSKARCTGSSSATHGSKPPSVYSSFRLFFFSFKSPAADFVQGSRAALILPCHQQCVERRRPGCCVVDCVSREGCNLGFLGARNSSLLQENITYIIINNRERGTFLMKSFQNWVDSLHCLKIRVWHSSRMQ